MIWGKRGRRLGWQLGHRAERKERQAEVHKRVLVHYIVDKRARGVSTMSKAREYE